MTIETPPPPPAGDETPPAFDWQGTLGDSYATHQSLLDEGKFTSPGDVLSALAAAKAQPAGLAVPGEDATPEQWAAFHAAIGRPEKAEDYGIVKPEGVPDEQWDGELATAIQGKAHELGLTPKQLAGLSSLYQEHMAGRISTLQGENEKAIQAEDARVTAEVEKHFGKDLPAKLELAKRAVAVLAGNDPEIPTILEGRWGAVKMISFMSKLGEKLGEARLLGDSITTFGKSAAEAKAELDALKADPAWRTAFTNSSDPGHKHAVERHNSLAAAARAGQSA